MKPDIVNCESGLYSDRPYIPCAHQKLLVNCLIRLVNDRVLECFKDHLNMLCENKTKEKQIYECI